MPHFKFFSATKVIKINYLNPQYELRIADFGTKIGQIAVFGFGMPKRYNEYDLTLFKHLDVKMYQDLPGLCMAPGASRTDRSWGGGGGRGVFKSSTAFHLPVKSINVVRGCLFVSLPSPIRK